MSGSSCFGQLCRYPRERRCGPDTADAQPGASGRQSSSRLKCSALNWKRSQQQMQAAPAYGRSQASDRSSLQPSSLPSTTALPSTRYEFAARLDGRTRGQSASQRPCRRYLVNKLARIAWAVLSSGEDYRPILMTT